MASLSDIANDIKNILNNIATDTHQTALTSNQIKADTAAANVKLDTINNTLQQGFALVANGLFAIHEAQKKTNTLLEENVEQNKAIICWLTIIADLLCRQLRKFNKHLVLQEDIRDSLNLLQSILQLVHAREALEVQKQIETEKKIAECCPPEEPRPEQCFEPCPVQRVPPYDPKGQDWKREQKPIG